MQHDRLFVLSLEPRETEAVKNELFVGAALATFKLYSLFSIPPRGSVRCEAGAGGPCVANVVDRIGVRVDAAGQLDGKPVGMEGIAR